MGAKPAPRGGRGDLARLVGLVVCMGHIFWRVGRVDICGEVPTWGDADCSSLEAGSAVLESSRLLWAAMPASSGARHQDNCWTNSCAGWGRGSEGLGHSDTVEWHQETAAQGGTPTPHTHARTPPNPAAAPSVKTIRTWPYSLCSALHPPAPPHPSWPPPPHPPAPCLDPALHWWAFRGRPWQRMRRRTPVPRVGCLRQRGERVGGWPQSQRGRPFEGCHGVYRGEGQEGEPGACERGWVSRGGAWGSPPAGPCLWEGSCQRGQQGPGSR